MFLLVTKILPKYTSFNSSRKGMGPWASMGFYKYISKIPEILGEFWPFLLKMQALNKKLIAVVLIYFQFMKRLAKKV